ncbi:hypothetical protein [Tunicatimonas pelagia]|uniref:hypothetical protein n=1 Tax=Tunicatimonas pelagia TaxID=931531 RepID=UPI0026670B08|nr:hypothetical protein [Tunicatimonas pelagia]WKN44433.1 hypothetical protein P0M28_05580 [Tunicatimonas pelagia]
MKYVLLNFLFIFLSLTVAVGQDVQYTFNVLAHQGEVFYRSNSDDDWQSVEIGLELRENHLIRIEKGGYLGLVHQSGKTVPYYKAGTYEVSRLHQRINLKPSAVAQKYANAYVESVTNPDNSAKETTRSVENKKLKMYLPNSVDVFSPEVVLRWKDQETLNDDYEVVFKNMFDEVLMVKDATDTKLWLDFEQEPIASERLLIVSVQKKQHKEVQSSSYGIKHMTPDESAQIEQELRELKLVFSGEENALDKLILASFYEQNNLLADALTSYEYAIELSPNIEAFHNAYDQFVFRNGLGL